MSAVFIHIPKNGGTSIRKIGSELGITMGNNSVVSNILPKHERWLDLNISKKSKVITSLEKTLEKLKKADKKRLK